MVQFLEELQGVATPALTPEEYVELEQLRAKYEKLKKGGSSAAVAAKADAKKKKKQESDDSSSDSEVSFGNISLLSLLFTSLRTKQIFSHFLENMPTEFA